MMRWFNRLFPVNHPDLTALRQEIERDAREIAETRPLVEEAIRRTNNSFIRVEHKTMRAILQPWLGLPDDRRDPPATKG